MSKRLTGNTMMVMLSNRNSTFGGVDAEISEFFNTGFSAAWVCRENADNVTHLAIRDCDNKLIVAIGEIVRKALSNRVVSDSLRYEFTCENIRYVGQPYAESHQNIRYGDYDADTNRISF